MTLTYDRKGNLISKSGTIEIDCEKVAFALTGQAIEEIVRNLITERQ